MKKPRENENKDFIGEPIGSSRPLPVSSTPEVQNLKPEIPPQMKNQARPNKSRVRLRR